mmetsp:Transcript_59870/g.82212  ORF Transcript_59870/g.82212 Transcript_59870/m.82212 type:complete len:233 (+) Transcript_59870:331-1029(+)
MPNGLGDQRCHVQFLLSIVSVLRRARHCPLGLALALARAASLHLLPTCFIRRRHAVVLRIITIRSAHVANRGWPLLAVRHARRRRTEGSMWPREVRRARRTEEEHRRRRARCSGRKGEERLTVRMRRAPRRSRATNDSQLMFAVRKLALARAPSTPPLQPLPAHHGLGQVGSHAHLVHTMRVGASCTLRTATVQEEAAHGRLLELALEARLVLGNPRAAASRSNPLHRASAA